jgi:hypothetical protein
VSWAVRIVADGVGIASLRIQTTEANKGDFPSVSPERYVILNHVMWLKEVMLTC